MATSPKKVNRFWKPERVSHQRVADNSKFYNGWAWRKFRKNYLNKNPLCVHCEEEGITTVAVVLDHIVRIEKGGCKLCEDNVQGLCNHHHNVKSGKEAHGFEQKNGDRGKKQNI